MLNSPPIETAIQFNQMSLINAAHYYDRGNYSSSTGRVATANLRCGVDRVC